VVPCWNKIILGQSTDGGGSGLTFCKIILFWHGTTAFYIRISIKKEIQSINYVEVSPLFYWSVLTHVVPWTIYGTHCMPNSVVLRKGDATGMVTVAMATVMVIVLFALGGIIRRCIRSCNYYQMCSQNACYGWDVMRLLAALTYYLLNYLAHELILKLVRYHGLWNFSKCCVAPSVTRWRLMVRLCYSHRSITTTTTTSTTTTVLRPFVRDYRGEPVSEETLTHPPSWSSSNLYHLLPSTVIHSILPVQTACLAIFLHNLSPRPLWSTSWSGTFHLIFHRPTFLHLVSVFFSQHMPIPSQPVLL